MNTAYPSDLTQAQYELVSDLIPAPSLVGVLGRSICGKS